ncbi:MAG TPA: ribonuclease R [Candidatus Lachnoclostridium avicola]|nr:ribonuclease R [Candidatus Lachnoclostridium avicola]
MDKELLEQRKKNLEELFRDPTYRPMKVKELAILLDIPKSRREELREVLDALVAEGKAGVSKKGKYGKPEAFSIVGLFSGTAKGFGFVTVEGWEEDVFIPPDRTGGALHGDRVQIVTEDGKKGRRTEGTVVRVLERANREMVGYYQKSKNFGFVIPDNQKISCDVFIPQGKDMGAVTGHKVVAAITDYGDGSKKPEGRIVEILGHINDPGVDILSVVRAYGLPEEFPEDVMAQAGRIPDTVPEKDKAGRLDLRNVQMVTIDGEDAKDLDDAVSLEKETGEQGVRYRLGVHIADVSHYVTEGSPLDREALKRSTSVYLVDRVIPMLPHRLSNGICSLNAGEDRLALSCLMEIDEKGKILSHRIAETVIRVDRRMSYTDVNRIITHEDEETMEKYRELVPLFFRMKELSEILRKRRMKRGAIDFDFPESKIILDEKGKPVDIRPYERNAATKLIEDFMLAANETVAEDYFWQEVPFLYRTHDEPDPEKMKNLAVFINNFGYTLRFQKGEIHPKELQKLLTKIEGTPEEALLSRLTLRSMKQAKYTAVNTGHFGLAAKYYTHFTSPIRRYPDLQIHRIIKENLRGGLSGKRTAHYERLLPEVAVQTSALERRADEAERETDKLKKCEYMSRFIGEEFDGVISGVTGWGFYVELPNTVEGLVRVSEMKDDYYVFDEQSLELRGEMTRRVYRLGQRVRVQVTGTDKLSRTIDFACVGEPEAKQEE